MGQGDLVSQNSMGKYVGEIIGVKEIWVNEERKIIDAHLNSWIIEMQITLQILSCIHIWTKEFVQDQSSKGRKTLEGCNTFSVLGKFHPEWIFWTKFVMWNVFAWDGMSNGYSR